MARRLRIAPFLGFLGVLGVGGGFYFANAHGLLGKNPSTSASAEPPSDVAPGAAVDTPAPALGSVSVRFCGSNTIGAELAPALAAEFITSKNGTDVQTNKSPNVTRVAGKIAGEAFTVEIRSAGTGTAFQEMAAGRCDIAMASREIEQAERDSLGQVGEHVLGLDGIAVIVNQSNPATSLALGQVSSLFAGTSSWSDVGAHGQVSVVSYDEKSGTYDTFKKLVLKGFNLSATAQRFSSSADVVKAVAGDQGAIAFTSLSTARGVKVLAISDKGTAPVEPTAWTVARESYPLTRRLYLYTSKFTRPSADSLVTFALSNAGQGVVGRSGFVDLSVRAESAPGCKDGTCPAEYVQATYGSQRLSVDFRFQNGSSELDSRALRDADRVAEFTNGKAVVLLGFADNSGAPAVNQRLSLTRADTVKAELAKHGITKVRTQGMGSLMPTASNDTEEGRQKNRRVEVWVQ